MQNQIFNSLQQIMSVKPNNGLSKEQWHFSELQKTEARQFRKSFPSEDHVLVYFAPSNWPAAVANPSKCLAFPSVTLAMIDRIYREGLSYNIVVNNIVGIFTITRPREPLYKEAIELTAKQFVGKFGAELSVFGMFLFFADYLTEYKSSYGQFDLTDLLRQCKKAFLPQWRARLGRQERQAKSDEGCKEVGKPALFRYLRREYIDRGIDVRTAPLVAYGLLSEAEIQQIESGEELPL